MSTAPKNRPGFTLLELLIVVVLIAILYGVFINKLQQRSPEQKTEKVTLQTLKETLSLFPAERAREIICTQPCKQCAVYLDGHKVKETDFPLFNTEPTVWKSNPFGQLREWEFLPLYDTNLSDEAVCFRYQLFRNGSGSNYIVQTDDTHFYVFKPMRPVEIFSSLSDAQKAFDSTTLLPMEQRDYLF